MAFLERIIEKVKKKTIYNRMVLSRSDNAKS